MANIIKRLINKLNPAQSDIVLDEGQSHYTIPQITSIQTAYEQIDVVNRGTNLIVDNCATINVDVGEKVHSLGVPYAPSDKRIRKERLEILLNRRPNPYINAESFRRNIYRDIILEGNAFIYFDGAFLYNLPAGGVEIVTDKKTYVKEYKYGDTKFKPTEVIHIKENSARTIFRGTSRLVSALNSINVINNMSSYQNNFFKNNAIPGLVLKTPNVLSRKVKDRIKNEWAQEYNPALGGRRPAVLDGEFEIDKLNVSDFRELDFAESLKIHEQKVLLSLGVPPILLNSGNNANISPNVKLLYITTIIPLVEKLIHAFEFYFGFDLKWVRQEIDALRPELREEGNYYSTLVNAGIMTRNEARNKLRLPKSDDEMADSLILPANVAGSASDSSVGGRPNNNDDED